MSGPKTKYIFKQNVDDIYDQYHEGNSNIYGEQDDKDILYIFKVIQDVNFEVDI